MAAEPAGGGLKLFGHPLHPALVHLPLGLCLASVLWDAAGILASRGGLAWTGTEAAVWFELGRTTLIVGLATAVPAAVSGFVDYLAIPAEEPAEAVARWHLFAVGGALTAYLAALTVRLGTTATGGDPVVFGLSLLGAAFLLLGGWLGGRLVYEFGVGRSR